MRIQSLVNLASHPTRPVRLAPSVEALCARHLDTNLTVLSTDCASFMLHHVGHLKDNVLSPVFQKKEPETWKVTLKYFHPDSLTTELTLSTTGCVIRAVASSSSTKKEVLAG